MIAWRLCRVAVEELMKAETSCDGRSKRVGSQEAGGKLGHQLPTAGGTWSWHSNLMALHVLTLDFIYDLCRLLNINRLTLICDPKKITRNTSYIMNIAKSEHTKGITVRPSVDTFRGPCAHVVN